MCRNFPGACSVREEGGWQGSQWFVQRLWMAERRREQEGNMLVFGCNQYLDSIIDLKSKTRKEVRV